LFKNNGLRKTNFRHNAIGEIIANRQQLSKKWIVRFVFFLLKIALLSAWGLTLSKQIALLHGGRILVESEEGKESTFTFAMDN